MKYSSSGVPVHSTSGKTSTRTMEVGGDSTAMASWRQRLSATNQRAGRKESMMKLGFPGSRRQLLSWEVLKELWFEKRSRFFSALNQSLSNKKNNLPKKKKKKKKKNHSHTHNLQTR